MAPTHLLSVLYYNKLCGGQGRADKELHKETLECPFVPKDSLAAVIFHPVPCWGKKKGNCYCTISLFASPHSAGTAYYRRRNFILFKCLFLNLENKLRIRVDDAIETKCRLADDKCGALVSVSKQWRDYCRRTPAEHNEIN